MLRAGYGISYTGGGNGIVYDYTVNGAPGANDDEAFQSPTLLTLSNITLPTRGVPFGPVGFNDRTKGVEAFDSNFVSPYVQNWNLEIQRNVTNDLSFAVRYIGSKGTKLQGEVATNEVNIFENGILDAFNITRAGNNAPLFDAMLMGLTVPGAGTVNGATLTGSQAFRISTSTRAFLANGDVGAFAAFLNNSVNFTTTGAGGIVRNAGLPENFITGNPQFSTANPGTTTLPGNATFITNISDSTYHSMQLEVSKRLSHGFAAQATYTWSHSLGIADEDGGLIFRTLRNRNLNKGPLGLDRRHQITSNGTFMLPFGPNRALLANAHPIVSRIVENWQLSGILNWTAGAPLTLTGARSSFNSNSEVPMLLGTLPSSTGEVDDNVDAWRSDVLRWFWTGRGPRESWRHNSQYALQFQQRDGDYGSFGQHRFCEPRSGTALQYEQGLLPWTFFASFRHEREQADQNIGSEEPRIPNGRHQRTQPPELGRAKRQH